MTIDPKLLKVIETKVDRVIAIDALVAKLRLEREALMEDLAKGRHDPLPERKPRIGRPPKFSEEQVRSMDMRNRCGETFRKIAAREGFSQSSVAGAVKRYREKG